MTLLLLVKTQHPCFALLFVQLPHAFRIEELTGCSVRGGGKLRPRCVVESHLIIAQADSIGHGQAMEDVLSSLAQRRGMAGKRSEGLPRPSPRRLR